MCFYFIRELFWAVNDQTSVVVESSIKWNVLSYDIVKYSDEWKFLIENVKLDLPKQWISTPCMQIWRWANNVR